MRANFKAFSERNASLPEENGELRRSSVVDPLVKRLRGNDGVGRGRGSWARGVVYFRRNVPKVVVSVSVPFVGYSILE